jgi:hypothetical protein
MHQHTPKPNISWPTETPQTTCVEVPEIVAEYDAAPQIPSYLRTTQYVTSAVPQPKSLTSIVSSAAALTYTTTADVAQIRELTDMEAGEAAGEKDTTTRHQRLRRRIQREEAGSRGVVARVSID